MKQSSSLSSYASFLRFVLISLVMLFALRVNYHNTPLPYNPSCDCRIYAVSEDEIAFERLLQSIPENASVTSSPEVRPHVTHRVESFTLPRKTDSADYIALIDQNRLVGDYSTKSYELRLRDMLLGRTDYELVDHRGHFYLFKRHIS